MRAMLGERGYVMATLGTGYNTRPLYDAYREGYVSQARPAPAADRFAYLGLVAVAANEAEARAARRAGGRLSALRRHRASAVPQPAGLSLGRGQCAHAARRDARRAATPRTAASSTCATASVQDLIDAGVLFCGTPDQVYDQIADFCEYCGGMGNLLMMGHAGSLSHDDTVDNLTLFAKEVLPRLKAYKQPVVEATVAA